MHFCLKFWKAMFISYSDFQFNFNSVVPEPGGGPGEALASLQYLADQLTLLQPGRADYPHLLPLAPPMFFTFRHHWCSYLSNKRVGYNKRVG